MTLLTQKDATLNAQTTYQSECILFSCFFVFILVNNIFVDKPNLSKWL